MSRNSSGTYTQPGATTAVSGATIDPTAFNTLISDLGNELTNSLDRGGRGAMTAALNAGGFKLTNAADPTLSTDVATKGYVDTSVAGGSSASLLKANNLSDLVNAATARTNLGLGTAAVLNTGTSSGQIPLLGTGGKLPAVDGSQLTGLTNTIVSVAVAEVATMSTATATIPLDDTIPQITEGTEIITITVTTTTTSQKVRLKYEGEATVSAQATLIVALFVDSTANALASIPIFVASGSANGSTYLALDKIVSPGAAGTYTYRIRVGPQTAATLTFNGGSGSRTLGGAQSQRLFAEVLA